MRIFNQLKNSTPPYYTKNKQQQGFTLAETLITLGIIGVLAAILIPPLMNNYEKTVTSTKLEKSYAEISIALKQFMTDSNCSDLICTGLFYDETSLEDGATVNNNIATNFTKKYFIVAQQSTQTGTPACYFNGDNCYYYDYWSSYLPINSSNVWIRIDALPNYIGTNLSQNIVAELTIDINGTKSPNSWGKDLFGFRIYNNGKLIPLGTPGQLYWGGDDSNVDDCPPNNTGGFGCTYNIMKDGWKITYY